MKADQVSEEVGWISIVSGTLIFSTGGIIIRYIDLPALTIAFWTQFVIMVILLIWQGRYISEIWAILLRHRPSFYRLLALGALRTIDRVAFTVAILIAPIAKVLVVTYLFPIYTMLLAYHFLDERITARSVGAALTALTGIFILVLPELGPASSGDLPGLVLGGIVGLAVATNRILIKGVDARISTPRMMLVESIVATMILAPIALMTAPLPDTNFAMGLIFLSGVLHGGIAHAIVLAGLRVVPAGPAATVGYLEPIVAALLAWWLLAEPISIYTFAGGLLILVGSLTTVLSQMRRTHHVTVSS